MGFLANLTFWEILILLLIIIITIFGLVFLVIFLISKFNLRIKTKIGEIGSKQTNKNGILAIDKKEFIVVVEQIKNVMRKQVLLQRIEKVRRQMQFAEEKILELHFYLEQKFLDMLKEQGVDPNKITEHEDYKNYILLLLLNNQMILGLMRNAFKENQFEYLENTEFNDYIERKIQLVAKDEVELLNQYYFTNKKVSKSEIQKGNTEKTKEIVRSVFMNAKKIYKEIRIKMFKRDKELDKFIWSLADVKLEEKNET